MTNACHFIGTGFFLGIFTGYRCIVPFKYAALNSLTGLSSGCGVTGDSISDPKSINAWLKSPGRFFEIIFSAIAWNTFLLDGLPISNPISNNRLITRIKFPSTAGSGKLKAILAIAPAVYGPIPFRVWISSIVSGNLPLYSPIIC